MHAFVNFFFKKTFPQKLLSWTFTKFHRNFPSIEFNKLGQNVCLDEISDKLENGSCWVKNKVSVVGQILTKTLCTL